MDTANTLLDSLRVPRQVIVNDRVAELEVQPFGARLCRNEHPRALSELVDQREPNRDLSTRVVRCWYRTTNFVLPSGQGTLSVRSLVVSAEQGDIVGIVAVFEEKPAQVVLRRQRFSEN